MTPDRVDVRVLQSMVDQMVGIPKFSYPARQNANGVGKQEKPADEFAHIALIEEYQEGIPAQTIDQQTDDQTAYKTRSLVRLRFRIGVVDTTGIPSSKIMNGWTSEAMKEIMISTGYGFIRCTPLSREDAKLEREWEFRKGFSVDLYVERTYVEIVDNIRQVTISGEFCTEPQDNYLLNIDINDN